MVNEATRHEDIYWSGDTAPRILNTGTKVVVKFTIPRRFTPEQKTLCTHRMGGFVGPATGLNDLEWGKLLPSLRIQL
jgi:hypothetical protein